MIVFPESSNPTASILIAAWRSAPYLFDCLESIRGTVHDVAYEVVIILNDPTDDLQTRVGDGVAGARVVLSSANAGFAGAANLGAAASRGKYLVLLNDDATVDPGWLVSLVDTAERRPDAGVIGSRICDLDGTVQEDGAVVWSDGSTTNVGRGLLPSASPFGYERRIDYCSGCSMLVRSEVWDAVGGMSQEYFPAYYEDVDFCFSVHAAGSSVWFQPTSIVRHRLSASTSGSYRSFLMERNRTTFVDRWRDVLPAHAPPTASGVVELDRAIWRAMGAPNRLLVVADGFPESIDGILAAARDAWAYCDRAGSFQLTLASPRPWYSPELAADAACAGIEIVTASPVEHLSHRGIDYALALLAASSSQPWADALRTLMPTTQVIATTGDPNFHTKYAAVQSGTPLDRPVDGTQSPTDNGESMVRADSAGNIEGARALDDDALDLQMPPALARLLRGDPVDETARRTLLREVRLMMLYRGDLEAQLVIVNDQIAEKDEYILKIEARLSELEAQEASLKRALIERRSQIDEGRGEIRRLAARVSLLERQVRQGLGTSR